MSEEQLTAFYEKAKGDTSLQAKLQAAAADNTVDLKAVAEIAQEAGFNITSEGIKELIEKAKAASPDSTQELSDEELQGVAGGLSLDGNRVLDHTIPALYSWIKGGF